MSASGTLSPATVAACCASFYGHPLVEMIAGQSWHPGAMATTHRLLVEARLRRGARLLDAGCGLGASARHAASAFGLEVDGCDISTAAVRRATALLDGSAASVRFHQASVLDVPFAEGVFAATLAECVLSTTAKRDALAELHRVTVDGGLLLASDVTSSCPIEIAEPLGSVTCLSGAWLPGELEESLAAAGYRVTQSWQESDSLPPLLDRLEARLGFLAVLARDAHRLEPDDRGGGLGDIGSGLEVLWDTAFVSRAFGQIRALVEDGRVGYRAIIARAT